MPLVCSVKFPYASRDLWFDANGLEVARGDAVICETERGLEYGRVAGEARDIDDATLEATTGGAELKPLVRIATDEDDAHAAELADLGRDSLEEFASQVSELGLDMKPVGVEYLFGGDKVVCYFVAENRVDFRQLARNLSRSYHARVDLRQIGVREQASIMGGLAHCGQEYCCSRLGQGFGPVTIRMAKDQDLPLNSPKISGACGRLMCCLRYENDTYRDFKRRAPKKNAVVETPLGEARVAEFDTPREAVGLRLEDNRMIHVPLASMEASDEAKERAERNGIPCRPDCVTLRALEALESSQVKLALAQLHAERDLAEDQWMPKEDLLDMDEAKAEKPGKGSKENGQSQKKRSAKGKARVRHRRRSRGSGAEGAKRAGQEPTGEKRAEAPSAKSQPTRTRSRRRHHAELDRSKEVKRPRQRTDLSGKQGKRGAPEAKGTQAPEAKAQGGQQAKPQNQDRRPGRTRRRRRHGGGGGGSAGQSS